MAGKFLLYVNQSLDATSDKISSFSSYLKEEDKVRVSRQLPSQDFYRSHESQVDNTCENAVFSAQNPNRL